MSINLILYLVGMGAIYGAERIFGGDPTWRWVFLGAGIVALGTAIGLRARERRDAKDDGVRYGHSVALGLMGAGLGSLLLYGLGSADAIDLFGFQDEFAERWSGVFGALWPIGWTAAVIPLIAVDHAVTDSPVILPRRRVRKSALNALAAVFGLALLFPLNYLATQHAEEADFSFFKTAEPSQGTRDLADGLDEPVRVTVFLPTSSDVLPEVRSYFDQLDADALELDVIDQAAQPRLARKLRVRDNGAIAFSKGPIDAEEAEEAEKNEGDTSDDSAFQSHVVQLGGSELDEARSELRELDEKVQKALLAMSRGQLVAYVVAGHGELDWSRDRKPIRRIDGLKQILEFMNFRVKRLGLAEGLAEEVPDDADLVLLLAPTQPLLPEVADSLRAYLEGGGALLLAAEPAMTRDPRIEDGADGLDDLMRFIGYRLGEGVLASDSAVVPLSRNKTDKLNITTDRFSVHPSTNVLADRAESMQLFLPTSGWLEEVAEAKSKRTITVRSRNETWADSNRNLELDREAGEAPKTRPIAGVAVGTADPPWRALVVADGSLLSDIPIRNAGNQQFVYDGVNWLTGEQGVSSAPESEEDVRIQHTREGQGVWFYGTVLGVPLLVLGFGFVRVRRRKRASEATESDRAEPKRKGGDDG